MKEAPLKCSFKVLVSFSEELVCDKRKLNLQTDPAAVPRLCVSSADTQRRNVIKIAPM